MNEAQQVEKIAQFLQDSKSAVGRHERHYAIITYHVFNSHLEGNGSVGAMSARKVLNILKRNSDVFECVSTGVFGLHPAFKEVQQ